MTPWKIELFTQWCVRAKKDKECLLATIHFDRHLLNVSCVNISEYILCVCIEYYVFNKFSIYICLLPSNVCKM